METAILEIVISLFLLYFFLAIIISAVNELWASFIHSRSKLLKKTIGEIFSDKEWSIISDEIINGPFIVTLKIRKKRAFPSYIPARTFSNAIVGILTSKMNGDSFTEDNLKKLFLNEENKLGSSGKFFKVLFERAKYSIPDFLVEIEKFWNDIMDRSGGIYKRKSTFRLIFLSLIITVALNIDSIEIAQFLWKEKKYSISRNLALDLLNKIPNAQGKAVCFKDGVCLISKDILSDTSAIMSKSEIQNKNIDCQYSNPVPVGWKKGNYFWSHQNINWWTFLKKLAGWFMTILALSFGAPFWFDLLMKIVNIRGVGIKPFEK